jgi:twitching motility protein PilI
LFAIEPKRDNMSLSRKSQNLREFQTRLAQRLKEAASAPTQNAQLGFLIGQQRYLVDLQEAGEILPLPSIAAVPMTKDWFRGMVNLRGKLFSVADFSRYCGGAMTPLDRESRLLAFGANIQFNASILISRMLGLRNVNQMQVEDAQVNGFRGRLMRDAEGQVWRELSLAGLAQDEQFLFVGR